MYPILFTLGSIVVPSWHFMYALGALAAFGLFTWLSGLTVPDVPRTKLTHIFAVCYVSGYFGARLLSIFIEEPEVIGVGPTLGALLRFGAMTFYGGAISAAFWGMIYATYNRLPVSQLLDCAIPSGLLALSLGRIGCFLNGDDFGKAVVVTDGATPPFWAVTFPNLGDGIARYPIQLIESGLVFILTLSLTLQMLKRHEKVPAGTFAIVGTLSYAVCRFLLEFLRDDYRGSVLGTWLSTSQGISVALVLICICFLVVRNIPAVTDPRPTDPLG